MEAQLHIIITIYSKYTISLVDCLKTKRPKYFHGTASFVPTGADGILRWCDAREEQDLIKFLYRSPKYFPFATPESADLWNRAKRVLY